MLHSLFADITELAVSILLKVVSGVKLCYIHNSHKHMCSLGIT